MRLSIRRCRWALTLLAVAGLLVTTLGAGCVKRPKGTGGEGTTGPTTEIVGEVEIGKKAPDFHVPDVDGREFTLSSLFGGKILLNFWSPT